MARDVQVGRRGFLAVAAAAAAGAALPSRAQAVQDISPMLDKITRGIKPRRSGVEIELPQIAENGNSVPIGIRVASPMSAADHVKAIYIFAERNPRPLIATFHLGPHSGRAEISTRVRLAGTQRVTVLAELTNDRFLVGPAYVLVTSAACMDEATL
jgi:sulfur-oxidizing protein SoxY